MNDFSDMLLVFPLYADGIPATLLNFLKSLENNLPDKKPVISVIINCGFLEYTSFNREKSIRRAESREKLLSKIEVLDKPVELNDAMNITLEPNILSGNDVLSVRGLTKRFDGPVLFQNVDFDIKRGERIAIIGNNGTGKTTILKIINGLVEQDAGEITLGARVHIGYYDQEHQVLHMDKTLFQEIQDTYPPKCAVRHYLGSNRY